MWLENFNEMRRRSGMSLDELSEKSGIPKGTLSKISSGITKAPTLDTVKALVYAMGYTLDDLDKGFYRPGSESLSPDDAIFLNTYHLLNEEGQKKVADYIDDLLLSGKYAKPEQSPGAVS